MKFRLPGAALTIVAAMLTGNAAWARQGNAATSPIPAHNVVLVHGLYADGSSWAKVIPLLQAKGLHLSSATGRRSDSRGGRTARNVAVTTASVGLSDA